MTPFDRILTTVFGVLNTAKNGRLANEKFLAVVAWGEERSRARDYFKDGAWHSPAQIIAEFGLNTKKPRRGYAGRGKLIPDQWHGLADGSAPELQHSMSPRDDRDDRVDGTKVGNNLGAYPRRGSRQVGEAGTGGHDPESTESGRPQLCR